MLSVAVAPRAPSASPPMSRSKWSRRPPSQGTYSEYELPDCRCKLTMLPVCVLRTRPGCRTLRRAGCCDCKRRSMPVCLTRDGCRLLRAGKPCKCERATLPECMALGCKRRKKGKMCQCPRWPGEPCVHVLELQKRIHLKSDREWERWIREWIDELEDADLEVYGTREQGAPEVALTPEARINLYESRANLWLDLFCEGDVLRRDSGKGAELKARREIEARRLKNQFNFLGFLAGKGGSSHGAA